MTSDELRIGMQVHYHPDGQHDGHTYTVRDIGKLRTGEPVAWLVGVEGCIALEAISATQHD